MANIKSAQKRISVIQAKTTRNRRVKSVVKTAIRRFEEALLSGNLDEAKTKLIYAEKKLMQAAAKGTIHKNAASRKIARLTKKLNDTAKQAM